MDSANAPAFQLILASEMFVFRDDLAQRVQPSQRGKAIVRQGGFDLCHPALHCLFDSHSHFTGDHIY